MNKQLAIASLTAFALSNAYAQVSIDTSGGTTGGAYTPTSSPINTVTGGTNNATGGAGGVGGTSSATTGSSTSQGGSVGNLSTGSSTSSGGSASVGNTTTGASTSTGGTSSATATGGNSTSSGNTSGNTTVTSNYAAPKIPVATAIAPSNFPTAPCMGSSSIGGSAVLFGFSAGSSWEATECMTFEAARSFDQAGMHEDALAIKCTSKYSAAAPSCIKLRKQEEQQQVQRSVQAPQMQQTQYEQPKPIITSLAQGIYSETVDPITGFTTIIDTRESYRRIGSSR